MKLNYSIKSAIVRKILQIDAGFIGIILFIFIISMFGSVDTVNKYYATHKNFASCVASHPVNDCKFILEK